MQKILIIFLLLILYSCKYKNQDKIDVSNVSVDFQLDRFDQGFYNNEKKLDELKVNYPFLFPEEVHDSVWINKRKDKDELKLFAETQKLYASFDKIKKELTSLFKHIKYYNPNFKSPRTITMLTNIDYKNRVVYADSLLLISLDAYLGENHEFYGDYPIYVRQHNKKEHLVVDVAATIVNTEVALPSKKRHRTFIDKIIYRGKKMYLIDKYLPDIPAYEKIGYKPIKIEWALANQEQIWQYFIEKDLLYSTNKSLDKRFLDIAPFSKFYTAEDNLSPGRIGEWIGWQIVKSFMKNNDVSLQELLKIDEEEIFKKSKYKPRR